jgi:predicted aldo/keto reductase-like oxidoreductase
MTEYPFDTILTALGVMHAAVRPFYETIMPVARERGVAVLAMKVMAYGFLEAHAAAALRFALGLDNVGAAVVGADNIEQLEANVAVARAFKPLSAAERQDLFTTTRAIYDRRRSEAWFIQYDTPTTAATT